MPKILEESIKMLSITWQLCKLNRKTGTQLAFRSFISIKIMKKNLYIFIIALFSACAIDHNAPSFYLDFEDSRDLTMLDVENKLKAKFTSRIDHLEICKGIDNNAIRFDGYSTFGEIDLVENTTNGMTVSCWVSLETYPTHSAGVFSLNGKEKWISLVVDRFGNIGLGSDPDNYNFSKIKIKKFEWHHFALNIEKKTKKIFLDGKEIISKSLSDELALSSLVIGKDSKEHFVHIFPTTYINGAMDELKLFAYSLTNEQIKIEADKHKFGTIAKLAPVDRFTEDFNRPKYHLLPAANWTNETHGLIYHNGMYHIFNQKNGTNVFLGQINWGHFSSTDLVQWTEYYPALTPEKGYDENGIWSGHVIKREDGLPVIFYTGSDGETFGMCMATPQDEALINWEKYVENPVILGTPKQYERADFRDPYLWKEGDTWYMIVGYGIDENRTRLRGTVLLYKSDNLKQWESLGTLFEGAPETDQSGVFWEMPVFWKFNNKYILLVQPIPFNGVPANSIYWVGDFINEKFIPDSPLPQKLEVINRLLSPSVNYDKDGNVTAIAIIPDLIPAEMQMNHGWTHLYSIPRIWTFENGSIHQQAHPNLKKLRESMTSIKDKKIQAKESVELINGKQLELILTMDASNCGNFGLTLAVHPDGKELTKLIFDPSDKMLKIDQSKTSLNPLYHRELEKGVLDIDYEKPIKLHLFTDGSVIEGFINDRYGFTTRIFPQSQKSDKINLYCDDGELKLIEAKIWTLRPSNNTFDF